MDDSTSFHKPHVLKRGDTVGILSPSSPAFEPGTINTSLGWLKKLGLQYRLSLGLNASYSSYAGSDEARAQDLMRFFCDPEIKAILPLRGVSGSSRLLHLLDYQAIAANPKIIVGFSDITALLVAINQKSNLVTFHGPTLNLMYENAYTYSYYQKALMSNSSIGLVTDPPEEQVWGQHYPPHRMIIAEGKAQGALTGGCLTLLRGLMGTPYEIDTRGKILFIEDVDEEPHNIDRMLCQLRLAGKLHQAAGIIFGASSGCRPGGSKRNTLTLNHSLEDVLRERLGDLGIPVVFGMRFGHTAEKITLPLGVRASLIATMAGVRFKIEEAACVDKTTSTQVQG